MRKIPFSISLLAALCFCMMTLFSCGDNDGGSSSGPGDGDGTEDPVDPVNPDKGEAMDPVEQKEYLETVAMNFMQMMPSSDFADIADLEQYMESTYFSDTYEWNEVDDWAQDIIDAARTAVGMTNTSTDTEIYGDYVYEYNSIFNNYKALLTASNFKGHFTASDGRWQLSEADDLQFLFTDDKGQQCTLSVETSGSIKRVHMFNIDDWVDYDSKQEGNKYISNDYYDRTQYTIGVPENITVTLTQAGRNVVKTEVNIDLENINGEEFDISTGNLTLSARVELNNGYVFNLSQVAYTANTDASVTFEMSKNNTSLATVALAADINDIPSCNVSAFTSEDFDSDDYNTDDANAKNAFVKLDITGDVQIQGTVSDVRKYVDYLNDADDNSSDEGTYKSYINQANSLADINLFYDGTAVKQASVTFEPFVDETWNGITYWTSEPVMNFYDGSSYSTFEAFFNETDFKKVIDTFKDLSNRYADLVGESIDW